MDWTNLPTVKDETGQKVNQVLTVNDRGSKQIILIPCWWKDKASVVASQFLHEVVRTVLPSTIVSDRDTKFTSVFRGSLCHLMDVKAIMTSPFHAQANGAAEKTNHTMKQVLRTVAMAKQQQTNVGRTPNGVEPLLPESLISPSLLV